MIIPLYYLKIVKKLHNNIYHCYEKITDEIKVFLEDYVYLCLLLITLYELENDTVSLNICQN